MKKNIIGIMLSLVLMVLVVPAISSDVYAATPASGTLKSYDGTITYTFDSASHTLNIEGTGSIDNYGYSGDAMSPFAYASDIRKVVIGEGITEIGEYAFMRIQNLESIEFPSTLKSLNTYWMSYGAFASGAQGFAVAEGNSKYMAIDGSLYECSLQSGDKVPTALVKLVQSGGEYRCPDTLKYILFEAIFKDVTLDRLTLAGDKLVVKNYGVREAKIKHLTIEEGVSEIWMHSGFGTYNDGTGKYVSCLEDETVTLPASLKWVEPQSLLDTNTIKYIRVNPDNLVYRDIDGVLVTRPDAHKNNYSVSDNQLVQYPGGRTETSYTVPDGIVNLDFKSMSNSYLKELILGPDVEKVKGSALSNLELDRLVVMNYNLQMGDRNITDGCNTGCAVVAPPGSAVADKAGSNAEPLPACTEHVVGTYETKSKATTEEDGVKSGKCKVCNEDCTAPIPKIASIKLASPSHVYDGQPADIKAVVTDREGKVLPEEDYNMILEGSMIDPGTVKCTVVANEYSDYDFTKELSFEVLKAKPAIKMSGAATYTYNGKTKSVKVDFLDMEGNVMDSATITGKKPGTYSASFAGNEFYDTAKASMKISVKAPTIKSLTRGKKSFTVKASQLSKTYVSGYQVRYSTKSSMSGAKTKTIGTKYTSVKKTVKYLKAKKKYYVQVRSYKTISGKKYYSAWSKSKAVTTK